MLGRKETVRIQSETAKLNKKGIIKSAKERWETMTEEKKAEQTAKVRLAWYPRWAEICGTDVDHIDFTNPIVSLEWKLADNHNLNLIKTPEGKAEFFKTLTEEEKQIYEFGWEYEPDGYSKLEKASYVKAIPTAIKYLTKGHL